LNFFGLIRPLVQFENLESAFVSDDLLCILQPVALEAYFELGPKLSAGWRDGVEARRGGVREGGAQNQHESRSKLHTLSRPAGLREVRCRSSVDTLGS